MTELRELAKRIKDNRHPEGEPHGALPDIRQDQIEAGVGLTARDRMTPEERERYRKRQNQKRVARHRRREATKEQVERSLQEGPPEPEELRGALIVTGVLSRLIDEVTRQRARKFAARLGTKAEDVTFEVFSSTNKAIAKAIKDGERDLEGLLTAAIWLADQPGIPNVSRDDPPHAGWLIAVIQNQARSSLRQHYERARKDQDEFSLEELASLDASTLSDPLERFMADHEPELLGWVGQRPGEPNLSWLSGVATGAITARGLDAFVEIILNDLWDQGRVDWRTRAEDIFKALGLQEGWEVLIDRTDDPAIHARYARGVARRAIAFLIPTLETAVDMVEDGFRLPGPEQLQRAKFYPDLEAVAREIIEFYAEA